MSRKFFWGGIFALMLTIVSSPVLVRAEEEEQMTAVDPTASTAFEDLGVAIRTDQPEGAVLAVALPNVYILPDSKLYWIVQLWESIQMIFAEDPQERADLLLELSKKRLSETYNLLKKDNVADATGNIERYTQQLRQALGIVQELPDSRMQQERYDAFEEQVWYQKALSSVIQVEGLSNIFADVTSSLGEVTQGSGSLQLTDLE